VRPCRVTSVESSISTTLPAPPEASVIEAPEIALRVRFWKLWMRTFSWQLPETLIVFGPSGFSSFRAVVSYSSPEP